MPRKAKREIAKARQRNASSRAAEAWAMQCMAVDLSEKDAEIERLRKLLKNLLEPADDSAMYDAMVATREYFSEIA